MGNKHSAKEKDIQIDELSSINDPGLEILKQKRFPFENVVFEGGNNKLLAYCGAVKILEETGVWNKINRLAGSGTGALAAALLATGNKSDHLEKLFEDDLKSLFTGCNKEKKLLKWIREKLKESTGKADITFEEVYWRFRKELCIVLTNVSLGCVEYCHVKTTPDLPIATAICLSFGVEYASNWMTQYNINGGVQETLTSGRMLLNYPIHCFDGWWLSMKPENSFLNRIQDLNDLPKILDRRNRFGEFNKFTIGISVFDDSTLDHFLLSLPTGKKENPQETDLTKIRLVSDSSIVSKQEKYAQLVTSLNRIIQLVTERKAVTDLLSHQDILGILENGSLTDEELQVIFGKKPSAEEILFQINYEKKKEITVNDLIKFSNRKRLNAHAQCLHDRCPIKKPDQYWNAVAEIIQQNNFRINTKKIDSKRTVGINTGFIRRSDFGPTLDKLDKKYLVQQGRLAMRIFLERYDSALYEKETKIRDSYLEPEEDFKKSSTNQNDFKQYIDDDISEVIDEREYMDTYFEKVL